MPRRRKLPGFTLIELVVVVAIISILAAIATPQYFQVVERARAAESLAMLATIRSAQERLLAQNGSYANANYDVEKFDVSFQGDDPTYGMKNFFLVLGPGNPAGCEEGNPFYNVAFVRITANAGVAPRYYPNYMVVYERCTDRVAIPGCAACATDFLR